MWHYGFEKLDVWKNSRALTAEIYLLTKEFPDDERFGLTSQIRRAMVSVSNNIAEGTSRWSGKEKARFIEISFGSLMEVLNCLIIASDLNYISEEKLKELREPINEIGNKLNALSKSFR